MKGILLISHGEMAKGMVDSISLFFGNLKQLDYLCLKKEDNPEQFRQLMIEKIKALDSGEGVIILADILGGTPFNEAAMISTKYDNIHVFAGLNMAMLFEAIDCREDEIDTDRILEESKNGMGIFKIVEELSEESDSDGI